MAKITTRKSTTLIQVDRPAERVTVPPVQTRPVAPPPAQQTIPVQNPAHTPAPQAPVKREQKPVAAPTPQPSYAALPVRKKGSPVLLVFLALLLIGGAASRFFKPRQELPLNTGDQSTALLLEDEQRRVGNSLWRNEQPGLITRIFHRLCLGYATSDGCREEPLHPFKQVYEELGKPLRFPEETDRKVIEQTIEYKSRGFAFRE